MKRLLTGLVLVMMIFTVIGNKLPSGSVLPSPHMTTLAFEDVDGPDVPRF